jgi:uncharacterized membrane protein
MTTATFRRWNAVIAGTLGLVVSVSIILGNILVPAIAVLLAAGLTYVLKRKTSDVMQDERTALLYGKAAGATIRFCVPIAAAAGLVLFAFRDRLSAEAVLAGYVLAYSACVILLVHMAFYSYYSRKL